MTIALALWSSGTEHFVDEERSSREGSRGDSISAPELARRAIPLRRGVGEQVDAFVLHIHEPGFEDAGARIEPDFDVAIVSEGRICDLDHGDDLSTRRVAF